MRTCPSVLRDCALLSAPVGWGRGAYLWAPRRPYIQDFTCLDVNIDPICARPEALPQSLWVSHKTVPNLCAPRSSSTKPLGQPQDCAQQTCLRVASLRSPSQGRGPLGQSQDCAQQNCLRAASETGLQEVRLLPLRLLCIAGL